MSQSKIKERVGYYVEIPPEELGELPWGHPDHHPDLHCTKYRFISPKMQEEQELAEKKLHKQFVEEPVQDPDWRAMFLIPKTNLRIPYNWFWFESDAAAFIRAVAKANNVGVHSLGKSTTGASLRRLMNAVWENRGLRMKKEEDPPRMSLQERRERHWEAVIDCCSVARGFSLRLVRHVTLMLVGASFDFAKSNGQRNQSNGLSEMVEKLCNWFVENDPEDLKAFECLQPERRQLHGPYDNGGFQSQRRGWAAGYKKGSCDPDSRERKADARRPSSNSKRKDGKYRPSSDLKPAADTCRPSADFKRETDTYRPSDYERKTDTYHPARGCKRKADTDHDSSDFRPKRQRQMRPNDDIEPSKRISDGKRGKRGKRYWYKRV